MFWQGHTQGLPSTQTGWHRWRVPEEEVPSPTPQVVSQGPPWLLQWAGVH